MRETDPFFLDKLVASLHVYGFLEKVLITSYFLHERSFRLSLRKFRITLFLRSLMQLRMKFNEGIESEKMCGFILWQWILESIQGVNFRVVCSKTRLTSVFAARRFF